MTELVVFDYQGAAVAFDPSVRMWSLTAMHQASGGVSHKRPSEWLRQAQTRELLGALDEEEKLAGIPASLVETREGRNGGTWAHWQIAAAYAHYLDPRFYLQWNRWAMERVTGQVAPSADLAALEARVAALEGKRGRSARQLVVRAPKRAPLDTDRILAMLGAAGGEASQMELYAALRLENITFDELITTVGRMKRAGLLTVVHKLSGPAGRTHTTTYTLTAQGHEAYQLAS